MPTNSQQPESILIDPTAYYLLADSSDETVSAAEDKGPHPISGEPVKEIWLKGIKVGNYRHRNSAKLGTDGKPIGDLKVTLSRMDGWIENFKKRQTDGEEPYITSNHDVDDGNHTLGTVVDLKRDGEWLNVKHRLVGEKAISMAARNKISLGIHPNFTDATGRHYGDSILHSAFTGRPVVPGAGTLIAASRGPGNECVYVLAAPFERSLDMPIAADKLARIQKLPGAVDVTEDGALDFLLSYAETTANLNISLSTANAEAEERIVTLSAAIESEPEVVLLSDAELSRGLDVATRLINLSVAEGDLPPVIADRLKKSLTLDGKPVPIMLSRSSVTDGKEPWDATLELFKGTKLGKVGHRGSEAPILLSREGDPATVTPERQKELRQMAGLPTE